MWIAQLSDPHLRPGGTLYKGVVDPAAGSHSVRVVLKP